MAVTIQPAEQRNHRTGEMGGEWVRAAGWGVCSLFTDEPTVPERYLGDTGTHHVVAVDFPPASSLLPAGSFRFIKLSWATGPLLPGGRSPDLQQQLAAASSRTRRRCKHSEKSNAPTTRRRRKVYTKDGTRKGRLLGEAWKCLLRQGEICRREYTPPTD